MATFKVGWTEEVWWTAEMNAASAEEALELFHRYGTIGGRVVGGEIQDSVTVEEVR